MRDTCILGKKIIGILISRPLLMEYCVSWCDINYLFWISRAQMLMAYTVFSSQLCMCRSDYCSMLCGYGVGALDTFQHQTYLLGNIAVMAMFKIAKTNLQL
jgi:hypothetical protein